MKNNFLLVTAFFTLLALVACNHTTTNSAQQTKPSPSAPAATDPGKTATAGDSDSPDHPAEMPYQYAGFQKTPCFGKCPVYEVKFFSDGRVTWLGRMNVERTGEYEARVDQSVLKSIKSKAEEIDFFALRNEYPVESKVADLPTTITYLRIGDMEKQVKNTYEAPENLLTFEKFLEDLIKGLTWRKVAGK